MKQINGIRTFLILIVMGMGVIACDAALAGSTVTGKVAFEGTAPVPVPINFGAEKQCAAMHADKAPVSEDLVVNPNSTVKWALVYIKEGATGQYAAPTAAVSMDQNGCMFAPHVVALMAGQKVSFKNSDAVLHNVRSASKVNKAFNIAQPIQGMTTMKAFAQPEVGVQMRCDVHFWMKGYIHVLSNPFFAITGDDGSFTIKDLPAGTYTLAVWHETLDEQTQNLTVGESGSKEANFTLKKA